MKILYVCWTYHHLIMATIKRRICKAEVETDLLIVRSQKALNDEIERRIRDSKVFNNVYSFNEELAPWGKSRRQVGYYLDRYYRLEKYMEENFPINIEEYDDIYLYYDSSAISGYLNIKKRYYHVIEDAKRAYTNRIIMNNAGVSIQRNTISMSSFMKLLQKTRIILPIWGQSKYCIDIEVDSIEDCYLIDGSLKKYVVKTEDSHFELLDNEDKLIIFNIFTDENMTIDFSRSYTVLLTEPLFKDGRVESIEIQKRIYKDILNDLDSSSEILIKAHPRDECDYTGIISGNVNILPKSFPAELFRIMPLELINKAVTVESSSVYSFPPDKRLIIGNEYIKKY